MKAFLERSPAPDDAGSQAALALLDTSEELASLRAIARALPRDELGGPISLPSEVDVFADLQPTPREDKLLGFYTHEGLVRSLEAYGVTSHLQSRGYTDVDLQLDLEHETGQRLRLLSKQGELLMELVLDINLELPPFRLLSIEWLMLQDPRRAPDPERPLLPGQDHPGLGCLKQVLGMLLMARERLSLEGLLFCPAHYHMAVRSFDLLRFIDPRVEAHFLALVRALNKLPMAQASLALDAGQVINASGESVAWTAAPMVLPCTAALSSRIQSPDYRREVQETLKDLSYRLLGSG